VVIVQVVALKNPFAFFDDFNSFFVRLAGFAIFGVNVKPTVGNISKFGGYFIG